MPVIGAKGQACDWSRKMAVIGPDRQMAEIGPRTAPLYKRATALTQGSTTVDLPRVCNIGSAFPCLRSVAQATLITQAAAEVAEKFQVQ